MLRNLNMFLQSLYLAIVPRPIQLKLSPFVIKTYLLILSVFVIHKKKKRLNEVTVKITSHCNLNCKYCSQFSPIADPDEYDATTFANDFERLYELTKGDIRHIIIMGGEPLLHPQLAELLQIARNIFHKSRISLSTNGILLLKQDDGFWNLCREMNIEIVISNYPVKINFLSIFDIAKKYNVKIYYKTKKPQTMYKWTFDVEGKQCADRSFYKCFLGNNCFQIDNGKLYTCVMIPSVKHFNKYFNKKMEVMPGDYIDIYSTESLEEMLGFLATPVPFCKYCNIDKISYGQEWGPSKYDISEWT